MRELVDQMFEQANVLMEEATTFPKSKKQLSEYEKRVLVTVQKLRDAAHELLLLSFEK